MLSPFDWLAEKGSHLAAQQRRIHGLARGRDVGRRSDCGLCMTWGVVEDDSQRSRLGGDLEQRVAGVQGDQQEGGHAKWSHLWWSHSNKGEMKHW